MPRGRKPKVNSEGEKELIRLEETLHNFQEKVTETSQNLLNAQAPIQKQESQTKLSQKELVEYDAPVLKPKKVIGCHEKFNEKYRDQWNFQKQLVKFTVDNFMVQGESPTIWTRPFPGLPAEMWEVPCNKPVWGPRHLAEQIKRARHNVLVMNNDRIDQYAKKSMNNTFEMVSEPVVTKSIQRLDATPVIDKKQFSMSTNFA